ncbi:MAG: VWA domain-containing protein [Actinomycetota bacterium]|nr:VWA domain-containing protein [Actinomycetota bacterium]
MTSAPSAALVGDELFAAFARALRHAGVRVSGDRTQSFLRAVAHTGAGDRWAVYWSGRGTLCSSPDDIEVYDALFRAWFDAREPLPRPRDPAARTIQQAALESQDGAGERGDEQLLRAVASGEEVLRHRDVASMSAAERRHLASLFARLRPTAPMRRSMRRHAYHRGEVDARRTLRDQLRRSGEPGPLRRRARRPRARRVVLLVDVSGSMQPYADALLRLGHVMTRRMPDVEVFTVGTRLTRVTGALHTRDVEVALLAAGAAVPDWSGGTRLGEVLRAFVDRWGQRGTARGAVVVIASDGWERGDPRMLGEQVARLQRLSHAVVWMNPHRGKAGYEPVQAGMAAALPHLDAFVAGHSLAAFGRLLEVVSDA